MGFFHISELDLTPVESHIPDAQIVHCCFVSGKRPVPYVYRI